ncbi:MULTISPECIES: TetR/AcrR family transcriptional regulator [Deinococcus]|uniref:TetR/AcrR family transcriptional regulator n=1 Tax=Deinococcus rufus TaxID=2136097 RepID=A0ABV7Z2R2_9DEIO|nr:TetR/AcrR family transcriptional regulator [Deinococcus sp. AB2017081]WQE95193.1 TetR/AcrR family transcriptional regulator [Deinococcus sp. AB2017081]
MVRPKSSEKRRALLDAATAAIVAHGLGATTAGIAQGAGVATGSFFTYFSSKTDLLNQLYLELKAEVAASSMDGVPQGAPLREQAYHVWQNWMAFAVAFPEKRRALTHLVLSEEITPETRAAAQEMAHDMLHFMTRLRDHGSLRDAPPAFADSVINALTEVTMDAMIREPQHAAQLCELGFKAYWRAIS